MDKDHKGPDTSFVKKGKHDLGIFGKLGDVINSENLDKF